jgi:hypothetical protein
MTWNFNEPLTDLINAWGIAGNWLAVVLLLPDMKFLWDIDQLNID